MLICDEKFTYKNSFRINRTSFHAFNGDIYFCAMKMRTHVTYCEPITTLWTLAKSTSKKAKKNCRGAFDVREIQISQRFDLKMILSFVQPGFPAIYSHTGAIIRRLTFYALHFLYSTPTIIVVP